MTSFSFEYETRSGRFFILKSCFALSVLFGFVGIALAAEPIAVRIPQKTLRCEVKDVKWIDDASGTLQDSPSKRAFLGLSFLLNTLDGKILSQTPRFDFSLYKIKIYDDGQRSGQWLKILYYADFSSAKLTSADVTLLTVQSNERGALKFRLADDSVIYTGGCS